MKIKILKITTVGGKYVKPGEELEVSKQLGIELCACKKAERVEAAPKGGVMTSTGTKPADPPKV